VRQYVVPNLVPRLQQGYATLLKTESNHLTKLGLVRKSDGLFWTASDRLFVPKVATLRSDCIHAVHSYPFCGHYGVTRTRHKVKEVFHWDNLDRDVAEFVQTCDSCQRVKAQRRKPQGELHPLPIPSRRWESISLDLITDLPRSQQGFDSIVVFVDRLSRMVVMNHACGLGEQSQFHGCELC
jgi:hypothetical protein